MTDTAQIRWRTMLNQARAFMEHDPHGALGRVDEVLRDIDIHTAADPGSAADAADARARALALRARCTDAYRRFQTDSGERNLAYQARIQRENAGPGHV